MRGRSRRGSAAPDAQPPLRRDPRSKSGAGFPGEGEAQGEAFAVEAADGPGDILRRHAFDEVGARAGVRGRPADPATGRSGRQEPEARKTCRTSGNSRSIRREAVERGLDDGPGAPFAAGGVKPDAGRSPDRREPVEGGCGNPRVDMDHDRAAHVRPRWRATSAARSSAVVAQHDETHRHAQFPLDMSPRISSCRQLMYFPTTCTTGRDGSFMRSPIGLVFVAVAESAGGGRSPPGLLAEVSRNLACRRQPEPSRRPIRRRRG
jgi:hypothetical protein